MWPCDLCDAQFTRRSKLEQHRLSHNKPRIIVVTPSGLRLSAQRVTSAASVAAAAAHSADNNSLVNVNSLDD